MSKGYARSVRTLDSTVRSPETLSQGTRTVPREASNPIETGPLKELRRQLESLSTLGTVSYTHLTLPTIYSV